MIEKDNHDGSDEFSTTRVEEERQRQNLEGKRFSCRVGGEIFFSSWHTRVLYYNGQFWKYYQVKKLHTWAKG